jgi:CRP/FNR family transcriptional regulator
VSDPLEILGKHPYFASLPDNVRTAVRRHVITRGYEKGTLIYTEGEPSQGLYLVGSGCVRIFKGSEDGREQDLHRIAPGQSFSDAAAFDGAPTVANAEAIESTLVHLIPRDALRDLMLRYPEIGVSVTQVLAQRVRELSTLAGELSLRHVVPRIAAMLLRLAGKNGTVILPTRHELAATVGTVREVATRGLKHLQRLGAIRLEPRRRVTLLDPALLDRLAGGTRSALPSQTDREAP